MKEIISKYNLRGEIKRVMIMLTIQWLKEPLDLCITGSIRSLLSQKKTNTWNYIKILNLNLYIGFKLYYIQISVKFFK